MVLPVGDRSERRRTSGSLQHSEPGKWSDGLSVGTLARFKHLVNHMFGGSGSSSKLFERD